MSVRNVRRHLRDWDKRSTSGGVRAIRYPYFINAPRNDNWLRFGAERCGCELCKHPWWKEKKR